MAKQPDIQALNELRPSELPSAIRTMMDTGVSLFVWGPPGVSKSAVSQQVATALGIAFIDVRLSQMAPTDLRGIPYTTVVGGETGVRWSVPYVMPRDLDISVVVECMPMEETTVHFSNPLGSNGIYYCTKPQVTVRSLTKGATAKIIEQGIDRAIVALVDDQTGEFVEGRLRFKVTGETKAILALEEFNSAAPSVMAAAYQLVLDKRLGEYVVPKGVYIMAMGNRETDRGVTFKMPTPVRNRYDHVAMVPYFPDWQVWAIGSRVHEQVIGFLSHFDNYLFQFDPSSDNNAFPTPRSWEFVSKILYSDTDMSENVERALICGAVGDAVGAQFWEFRKIADSMPDPEDILQGRLRKLENGRDHKTDISIAYALTTILCYRLKDRSDAIKKAHPQNWRSSAEYKEWVEQADNFLRFMLENFKVEVCVMGAKAAISIHKLPFDTAKQKYFDVFCNKFKDMIIGTN